MFFWIREIAGWSLVLLALYWLRSGILLIWDLESPQIIQASVIVVASTAVLRAGIYLIRLSTTSRLATQYVQTQGVREA
ncbi:MAG: hypothetical protein MUC43_07250 [Pirellula sp.]|jgi:hypothetical protein|nr:hypothetical protein [Pirellula sp.]